MIDEEVTFRCPECKDTLFVEGPPRHALGMIYQTTKRCSGGDCPAWRRERYRGFEAALGAGEKIDPKHHQDPEYLRARADRIRRQPHDPDDDEIPI